MRLIGGNSKFLRLTLWESRPSADFSHQDGIQRLKDQFKSKLIFDSISR